MCWNRLVKVYKMNKLQLIDLDTSSEDEEMGGVMVSQKMIQNRLGWLSTVAEPQMEQKTKAAMEIEVVQEKHNEDQVQDKHDNQQNQELTEPPEVTRSTEKENIEKGEGEKNMPEILAHVKVMEVAKNEKEEIDEEWENKIDKQEIQQVTGIGTTQQMTTDEPKSEESDTPMEENEEAMLPKGGVLLMFMEKASPKQKVITMTEIQATSTIEEPEGGTGSPTLFPKEDDKAKEELQKLQVADVSTPKDDGESSEKSQKSQVDSIVSTSLTSQHMAESVGDPMEEIVEENPFKMNMWEKLIKATNKLGGAVKSEENIQIPAIGLLLRIQAALDEWQIFLKNSTVKILDIINKISDKSATAWQEKLKGETIDSH